MHVTMQQIMALFDEHHSKQQAYRGQAMGNAAVRAKDRGRALYATAAGQRVVIVLAFQKTTPKTPRRMIELALKRAKSVPL